MYTTYQCIPLLYIVKGINTDINTFHEAEDLNPKQQLGCEELINCSPYFINIFAAPWDAYEVICPKLV